MFLLIGNHSLGRSILIVIFYTHIKSTVKYTETSHLQNYTTNNKTYTCPITSLSDVLLRRSQHAALSNSRDCRSKLPYARNRDVTSAFWHRHIWRIHTNRNLSTPLTIPKSRNLTVHHSTDVFIVCKQTTKRARRGRIQARRARALRRRLDLPWCRCSPPRS